MTWQIARMDAPQDSGPLIYETLKHHRMVPQDPVLCVAMIRGMTADGVMWAISNDQQENAALVILSNIFQGNQASLDLVIVPRLFKNGESEDFSALFLPVMRETIEQLGLRRLTSMVPVSRNRTKAVLKALGFQSEGRMRLAWQSNNQDPEDVLVLGWVKEG